MSANGELAASELQVVDGVELSKATAQAFMRMRGDCQDATGVLVRIARPAGGYRPLWMQRDMRVRPGLYNIAPGMVPFLASPGNSTHGTGRAVDLTTATRTAASRWLLANCGDYGFAKPPPGDLNHFLHNGTVPAGGGTKPIPVTTDEENEDDMPKASQIHYIESGKYYRALLVPGTPYFVEWNETGGEYGNAIAKANDTGSSAAVTPVLFAKFRAAAAACLPAPATVNVTPTVELGDLAIPTAEQNGAAARDAIVAKP